ncbi:MAG TPA: DUF1684 domain-containing protein [Candidatus Limnocylindrales bacterium]|nr:DUF1684 domain-containing protein [Candidatus Limnocylindrales bacterium]
MTDHGPEHEHDHEHDHEHEGHEHEHQLDWASELEMLRESARHFYEHQFDWRGHAPPEGFEGPKFYAADEQWRIEARLDSAVAGAGDPVQLATSTGQVRDMTIAGDLVFDHGGGEHRLQAFRTHSHEGYESLFVPFRDATSGTETYGAGRYIDIPLEEDTDGPIDLDFNFAYNPSCVFSPAYDCPYPPPRNKLSLAVRAGERMPFEKSG